MGQNDVAALSRAVQARVLGEQVQPAVPRNRQVVLDIVRAAQRHEGLHGLTRSEIRVRWEELDRARGLPGRRDESLVSSVVNRLLKSASLVQLSEERICSVTGNSKSVVAVPGALAASS
jgi:hypothetical protein